MISVRNSISTTGQPDHSRHELPDVRLGLAPPMGTPTGQCQDTRHLVPTVSTYIP